MKILTLIGTLLLIFALTGCAALDARLTPDADKRLVDAAQAPSMPTNAQKFTVPKTVELPRGGEAEITVGLFSFRSDYTAVVGGIEVNDVTSTKEGSTNVINCEDEDYEYTLELESPLITTEEDSTIGVVITLVDDQGVMADEMMCTIGVIETSRLQLMYSANINVKMI